MREPDALHHVPVEAARWQCERPAWRSPDQTRPRVELAEQRIEVGLVYGTAVQEHERARRLGRGGPRAVREQVEVAGHGYMLSGASTPSRSSTRAITRRA